jgi:hypothetical protein
MRPGSAVVLVALLASAMPGAAGPAPEKLAAAAQRGPRTLAAGGLALGLGGEATLPQALAAPPPSLALHHLSRPVRAVPAGGPRALRPKAVGDTLLLSLDDDLPAVLGDTYEARLDVSGGVAGASDLVAVRFPSQSLAVAPPFRVRDVVLGLDDVHGRTTFPAVEVWVEDPLIPLTPGSGPRSSAVTNFDAAAAGLPAPPPGATRPTAFARLPVGMPPLDVPDAWLSDGSFDDDFDRADEPLDNLASDWLECQDVLCGGDVTDKSLSLSAGRVVRDVTGASSLAVKFQAAGVFDVRPAHDIDTWATVDLDLSAPTATRAGLAVRALGVDAFYRVEYVKATDQVEVDAVTPATVVALGAFNALFPSDTPRLGVRVTGGERQTMLEVYVGGAPIGTATDPTFRMTGRLLGLVASDPASSGEAWDALAVERRPDVFTVVRLPPGEDVGLPLDVSTDSVISGSVLLSSDGVTYAPLGEAPGCVNPGNPFVQLEVEDIVGDRLFEQEAHVVALALTCPTCPTGPDACLENAAAAERRRTVYTEGRVHDVTVSWWNEHLSDADRLIFRASAWDAPCSAVGALVAEGTLVVGPDDGQRTAGPVLRTATVASFTPPVEGAYCVVVEEWHDLNGDCCPDGAETVPIPGGSCPGPCAPAPGSDSNPSTAITVRDVRVEAACTPVAASNLDGRSLRVERTNGDRVRTTLRWDVVDPFTFPARYNFHLMEAEAIGAGLAFLDVAPIVDRPVGVLTRDYDLTPPAGGRALWMSINETDGCPSGNSLLP